MESTVLAGVLAKFALVAVVSTHSPAVHVTVRPGDTLSQIAAADCGGKVNDWTGIYKHNQAIIGADPNLIIPGQRLKVVCTDPPALLKLGSTAHTASAAPSAPSGDKWDGQRHACGDGDGDGYDMPCSYLPGAAKPAGGGYQSGGGPAGDPGQQPAPIQYQAVAGVYSYGQLEILWESAGGPSFAAAQAAQIAECESGGNPHAYNPSGASGIWQILGSVVPGNLFDPMVNALNAVSKFHASGDTFAQWVCQ